jgi:hypothetical protein
MLVGSAATSFLVAAATVEAVYTIRVTHVLAAAAVVIGFPCMILGWLRAPRIVQVSAVAALGAYLLSSGLSDQEVIGASRAGARREVVYLADLVLGLAVCGLTLELFREPRYFRRLAVALAAGAILAAAYASYQWLAQHFDWPFDDVNNTVDSNGVTVDGNQGAGLLGWERARGTFLEPHYLAGFLASTLPLLVALVVGYTGRTVRWIGAVGIVLSICALAGAGSAPGFGLIAVGLPAAVGLAAVRHARPALAALAAAAFMAALLIGVLAPDRIIEVATGRTSDEVALTTGFRTATWERGVDLWSRDPLIGSGPGQASVRLSLDRLDTPLDVARPGVLRSAHGWWIASLLDAGLLGLLALAVLIVSSLSVAVRNAWSTGSLVSAGVAAAAVLAVAASSYAGDRLDVRVWLLLGLALATPRCAPGKERDTSSNGSA